MSDINLLHEIVIEDQIALKIDEASSIRRVNKKTFSLLVGNYWLLFSAVLLILSLIINQIPLLLVSLIFFFTGSIARIWDKYCLSRIEFRRKLSSERAFFGDNIYLEISVANRKPLPLPWFQIEEEVPADITVITENSPRSENEGNTGIREDFMTYGWYNRDNRTNISHNISLGWYNRITRRYPIHCDRRGLFAFGPTRIRSGDLFGIFSRESHIMKQHYLIVYPKMVPLEQLGIPSRQLFGDIRTRSHIFEDPVLTMGIRDYQFGDSLKRVHWKATARTGKLQTKVFELTTTTDIALFLDVRTTNLTVFGVIPELLELAVVTAASITNHTITAGYRTGLYVNQKKRFPDEPMRMPPGQHSDQMMHILDALAQVTAFEAMPISRLIQNESRNLSWGSTIMVLSAYVTDELLSTLYNMKRSGRRVVLVTIGDQTPVSSTGDLAVFNVSESISWRDIDSISLRGS
ncbi:MAG: hypothetical protein A2158_00025 [Chloroflexi bacterium RBG_13_46_14]|nr:MAG: hypothetical protein A2158_00025 [Chloroflexi bacterium RBG_13_46_14]